MTDHDIDNTYALCPSLAVRAEGDRILLSWPEAHSGREHTGIAGPDELLGLKIVSERLSLASLASEHNQPLPNFLRLLSRLDRRGILQAPPTLLRRDPELFGGDVPDDMLTATSFGLQIHITNACDLHCRHCYDRSRRANMTEAQALRILDELDRFCRRHWVTGFINFSGGNPFLHPEFLEMYQEAVRRRYDVVVLGNPVRREQLEALCRIQPPSMYQVSLEGRRSHNDAIRGAGSYDRAIAFLDLLREVGVDSCVMLTLTAANLREVLPLAAILEGKTSGFCFNRLSRTGEGAALDQPDPRRYREFLGRYLRKAAGSQTVSLKDNLINLKLAESGQEVSRGCTGYGCGAAFNCLSVLPDGQVYGCRKFPSPVGNIYEQSLEEIYFSSAAARYRRGMRACDGCPIRHACGGCMAVADRPCEDLAAARDPFCWRISGNASGGHGPSTRPPAPGRPSL